MGTAQVGGWDSQRRRKKEGARASGRKGEVIGPLYSSLSFALKVGHWISAQ